MNKVKRLWWTLFDRTIDDDPEWQPFRLSLNDAIMANYNKPWKLLHRKMECGCTRRRVTHHMVLYAWKCPVHMAWLNDEEI